LLLHYALKNKLSWIKKTLLKMPKELIS
jgi:hypothetical protein